MYLPSHFREERIEVMQALMRAHPLATLVTSTTQGLLANHVPIEVDGSPLPNGTLRGHLARANPAWREHLSGTEVLVIYQGPQTYVSPSWYPSKKTDARVVPTWNYAVVHAWGPLRVVDDAVWLRALVGRLTTVHEANQQTPWRVEDAPADYIERMLAAIVGFEIPIARIEGKWKMSQNRPRHDREAVAQAVSASPDLAALIRPPRDEP